MGHEYFSQGRLMSLQIPKGNNGNKDSISSNGFINKKGVRPNNIKELVQDM